MKLRIKMSPLKTDENIAEYGDYDEYQYVLANRSFPGVKVSTGCAQSCQRRFNNSISADVTERIQSEEELRDS